MQADTHDDQKLAGELGALTAWEDREGGAVWERAVEAHLEGVAPTRRMSPSLTTRRWAIAAAVLLTLTTGIVTLPNLSRARYMHVSSPEADFIGSANDANSMVSVMPHSGRAPVIQDYDDDGTNIEMEMSVPIMSQGRFIPAPSPKMSTPDRLSSPGPELPSQARHVVRKATIQLVAGDVRAVFTLAGGLVSEARGEYVGSANIRERDEGYEADLELRIEATRLDSVLNELRGLGEVVNDRIDADDVTDRVVDLEARLRNEQRIETELLELLETRTDDELSDVLAVRRELGNVRGRIEQLTAQRNQIGQLVRLATITVIIREPDEEKPEPEKQSGWERFTGSLEDAALDGVQSLGHFVTWLVRAAIGGLPLWIGLTLIGLLIRRMWVASNPKRLPE